MNLKEQFPQTYKALKTTDSFESTLEHILALENRWQAPKSEPTDRPDGEAQKSYDVVLAGGGISIVFALMLAKQGLKVAVFDRRRIAEAHREWNISYNELQAFDKAGVFSQPELDKFINLRYERGIVRWHGGSEHAVTGVLDCAVDAQKLLDGLREKLVRERVDLYDHCAISTFKQRKNDLLLTVVDKSNCKELISCRLLLDGRGAMSEYGEFDIVCPTVGGVLSNLECGEAYDQVDTKTGEILVSLEGVECGKQHIWEGFPTRDEMMTTYLFYYSDPEKLGKNPLLNLYERFFRKLHTYKKGDAVVEKPTYGFIPGKTRLSNCSVSFCDRIYLVGDAAGLHSPLTFCGFGSVVRTFEEISVQLHKLLLEDRLDQKSLNKVNCQAQGLRVMGGLALMMIADRLDNSENSSIINELLDDAFNVLAARGESVYRDFMQDKIKFSDFVSFMLVVSNRRPSVWREVLARMSGNEMKEYFFQLSKFGFSELKN